MAEQLLCYHSSTSPDALANLTINGSRGKGPSTLGLWTMSSPEPWQRSYGDHLHQIEISPAARVIETTSRELCKLAGTPSSESWRALASTLRERADVVMLAADDGPHEIVILDHRVIANHRLISWEAALS